MKKEKKPKLQKRVIYKDKEAPLWLKILILAIVLAFILSFIFTSYFSGLDWYPGKWMDDWRIGN